MEQYLNWGFFIHFGLVSFCVFLTGIVITIVIGIVLGNDALESFFTLFLIFIGPIASILFAIYTAPGLPIDDNKAIAKIEYLEQEGLVSSYKLRKEETCFIEYINKSELDKEGESEPSYSRDAFDCTQASSAVDRIYDLLTTDDFTALYAQAQPETLKRVQAMQDAGLYIRFYSTTPGQCTMRTIDNERHIDSRITHDCKQFDKFIKNYARELGL